MYIKNPKINRALLQVNKHSPEILLVGGIVGFLGTVYLSSKATLDAQKQKTIYEYKKALLEEGKGQYTFVEPDFVFEKEKRRLVSIYAISLARLYGPAVALGFLSIGMLIGSNRIMNNRNAALMGAYALVEKAYRDYRSRVKKEFGEDVDSYLMYKKPIDKKKLKNMPKLDELDSIMPGEVIDPDEEGGVSVPSMYSVFFDENSIQWRKDPEMNRFFLLSSEKYMNEKLSSQGHLFLNEVYDSIGVPRTKAGAVVGWVSGYGDDCVDFGIYNPWNKDFVNQYQQDAILLDFNVDGVIYDKI